MHDLCWLSGGLARSSPRSDSKARLKTPNKRWRDLTNRWRLVADELRSCICRECRSRFVYKCRPRSEERKFWRVKQRLGEVFRQMLVNPCCRAFHLAVQLFRTLAEYQLVRCVAVQIQPATVDQFPTLRDILPLQVSFDQPQLLPRILLG